MLIANVIHFEYAVEAKHLRYQLVWKYAHIYYTCTWIRWPIQKQN